MNSQVMFGALIIQLGGASALAYIPLQIYLLRKWAGAWRLAAALPLILMVPVIVVTGIALAKQSNLWPIVLIFAAPVGTGYLLLLMGVRWLQRDRVPPGPPQAPGSPHSPRPRPRLGEPGAQAPEDHRAL